MWITSYFWLLFPGSGVIIMYCHCPFVIIDAFPQYYTHVFLLLFLYSHYYSARMVLVISHIYYIAFPDKALLPTFYTSRSTMLPSKKFRQAAPKPTLLSMLTSLHPLYFVIKAFILCRVLKKFRNKNFRRVFNNWSSRWVNLKLFWLLSKSW